MHVCVNECVYIILVCMHWLERGRHFISMFNSVDRACAVPYNYRSMCVCACVLVCVCVCVCEGLPSQKAG